ncbi:CidA/LrgA family protein [Pokkaliibacter sp. MBI-7]|uniref:CidA/LrgA family protein n=1 Tax=Pokkaliibacter sp. MBI-7 TaxID=3040600 RepID=UPI002448F755|nr:CidA/LrgA family protein [Pokkaliibacter sp. MBI-7]MDH2434662.1 CidA/LrgA family protein [Pokkaliibacter sp. MBI-7]
MAKTTSFCKVILQLALFCGLLWLCNLWVNHAGWSIPGSVIGLGILVFLLATRVLPVRAVQAGSTWLLGELLLFFIPPVVSILKYQMLIREDGLMILVSVVLGTVMVLTGTAWVVDRVFTLEQRLNERRLLESGGHV